MTLNYYGIVLGLSFVSVCVSSNWLGRSSLVASGTRGAYAVLRHPADAALIRTMLEGGSSFLGTLGRRNDSFICCACRTSLMLFVSGGSCSSCSVPCHVPRLAVRMRSGGPARCSSSSSTPMTTSSTCTIGGEDDVAVSAQPDQRDAHRRGGCCC